MSSSVFPQQIIARKRDGHALTRDEVAAFVRGVTDGAWADYQASALLMAILLRGMNAQETAWLTEAMMNSGVVADLSSVPGVKVDKHSTGGVGDKVSLILAPMVAACGVPVPMISGRGLGHTGGTLDKLEAIPGFNVRLSMTEYREQLQRIGVAMIGQTDELAPADRKLYSLRDVTATVESIPLICGSIMCKKLAEGIDALVLDVKFGRGAFMQEKSKARELAAALVAIGKAMGKPTRALLTAMDQPLGRCVGNALEVAESIECLRGRGPDDLMEVTYALGSHMLVLGGQDTDLVVARSRLRRAIADGRALEKFRQLIAAQGGDAGVIDDLSRLPTAPCVTEVTSSRDCYIEGVDALQVAHAAMALGAGRARTSDGINPAVGFSSLAKIGDFVKAGDLLCRVHAADAKAAGRAQLAIEAAISFTDRQVTAPALIDGIID